MRGTQIPDHHCCGARFHTLIEPLIGALAGYFIAGGLKASCVHDRSLHRDPPPRALAAIVGQIARQPRTRVPVDARSSSHGPSMREWSGEVMSLRSVKPSPAARLGSLSFTHYPAGIFAQLLGHDHRERNPVDRFGDLAETALSTALVFSLQVLQWC